jgi:hypothetical protein
MSIQTLMYSSLAGYAGLAALAGARVYPDIAPQNCLKPYAVWQEIALTPTADLSGTAESNSLNNHLVQVSCWASTAKEARDLDAQVRLAMNAATGFKSLLRDSRSAGYEQDTKSFGIQSDFSVWLKT